MQNGTPIVKAKKTFIHDNFLLENDFAIELYHQYAKDLPIIDYHNHLPPKEIAENKQFENITQIWLEGDHYKWRAMRAQGVEEQYITGDVSDLEKFEQWAATMPYTLRNPLYHWSHLELKRYFDIDELLTEKNAQAVYETCNQALQKEENRVVGLLEKMKVEVLCTTDDPTDNLHFHQQIAKSDLSIKILPAFRPDKAILIENSKFVKYIQELGVAANIEIKDWESLQAALEQRLDFFHSVGCRLSDHGLEQIVAVDFSESIVNQAIKDRLAGKEITATAAAQYQSAILHYLGLAYHKRGWVQQLHLGALRNQNARLLREIGADAGCDSIGDFSQAASLGKHLNRLDQYDQLAKTVLYNLNPRDNEVFAAMLGNFSSSGIQGKMQYGSAWWFLDQLDGMEKQINTLSNIGLLSGFVGMLTDSRSFLSFPRHEYFRRLLCNIFGKDIAKGHLPNDLDWIGKIVQDICYYNAKEYFDFS
ncbi:MAG: glucuronate isomerase [Bacteroidota bacterium]